MTTTTWQSTLPTTSSTSRPLTKAIFATDAVLSQTLLRLTLGVVLLPHGLQHAFGWFGGYGFGPTVEWMVATLGVPPALAAASIVVEVVAPLALILGAGARLAGVALAAFMATAASTHAANGFFMNWMGTMPAGAEGFEFHLLAIAIAVAIVGQGAGAYSIDRLLARSRR